MNNINKKKHVCKGGLIALSNLYKNNSLPQKHTHINLFSYCATLASTVRSYYYSYTLISF